MVWDRVGIALGDDSVSKHSMGGSEEEGVVVVVILVVMEEEEDDAGGLNNVVTRAVVDGGRGTTGDREVILVGVADGVIPTDVDGKILETCGYDEDVLLLE